jgi:exonuclease VII small subunit
MVDAIGGAGKAGAEVFKEATKQLQNANDQMSKFEELRQKLETQDLTVNKPGGDNFKIGQQQNVNQTNQTNAVEQTGQANQAGGVQKAGDIPKVKDMDHLEQVVDRMKHSQDRLKEILDQATSGKTYSPQELIAMQTEVGQLTNEISLACKMVEQGVSSVKSMMQMSV